MDDDTGTVAEVEPVWRRDDDAGNASNALYGGDDTDAADAAFAAPGEVTPIDGPDS